MSDELKVTGPPVGGTYHERHKRQCHEITRDGRRLGFVIKPEDGQWEAWALDKESTGLRLLGRVEKFDHACEQVADAAK